MQDKYKKNYPRGTAYSNCRKLMIKKKNLERRQRGKIPLWRNKGMNYIQLLRNNANKKRMQ